MLISRCYTGVGSRKTPPEVMEQITGIAQWLSQKGMTLRSGGADGADTAFESGSMSSDVFTHDLSTEAAEAIAARFHPAWNKLGDRAKKLHGRNAFQVLGGQLDKPSDFVICWTPDGCVTHSQRSIKTGGTGTAISIATFYGIPVFNLNDPISKTGLKQFLRRYFNEK